MDLLTAGVNLNFTAGAWLLAINGAVILTYAVSSLLAWRRLRQFNGPFSASFSHYWLARASYSGRMGEEWAAADAKYGGTRTGGSGSTVRIGPNELLTSDPSVIWRTSAARSRYARSTWYKMVGVDPYHDSMFSTLDTATHDRLKAQTAPGYTGRDHPTLEAEVDRIVAMMVDRIRSKYAVAGAKSTGGAGAEEKKPLLDLATMAQYFTLDSISKIAFGEEFGLIREERDIHGHMEIVNEIAAPVVTIAVVPILRAVMGSKLVLKLMGPKPEDKRGVGRMLKIGMDVVAKRFGPDAKEQDDMLGSFIRHGLTQRECQTEALIQILAGSDTTATTIRATMLYLMCTPRAYHALQAEIDEGIRTNRISSPVTNAEANELPYLQAVILEGLRIHPPFTGLPFKVVAPGGDTIDGKPVPAGTLIAPNFWATGRLPAVFGADADIFRPERWLEQADAEKRAEMRRVAELVFGYGRWGCAGKMIAFLELNKVFVELLRRFDFQLANPARPWKSANYNLFLQSDMWVAVSLRDVETV
ncbi:cytochrome P450 monooxygenase [Parathielavia appendiculata]|uniref:Cytochrome P450 monooxygenase ABA1 n=1 Tax=Parathielavia appendiculata TaxID=2587402 RepID=A0AAN6Z4Z3_9PEZI|nr:cytochrome P450 monooxygenase [Parathielavia appendiculata]